MAAQCVNNSSRYAWLHCVALCESLVKMIKSVVWYIRPLLLVSSIFPVCECFA